MTQRQTPWPAWPPSSKAALPARGGDPDNSYVARLLHKGPDAFLKKIGEEATEVVMAAKDADHGGDAHKMVNEVADLWFHSMIALAHYGLSPARRGGRAGAPRGHQRHRGKGPAQGAGARSLQRLSKEQSPWPTTS